MPPTSVMRRHRPVPDPRTRVRALLVGWLRIGLPVLAVLAVAAFLRFWQLDAVGFNSDEAVYTATAASIAGNQSLSGIFPIFRAHPVLFQMLLSLIVKNDVSDGAARTLPALIGVSTVAVT